MALNWMLRLRLRGHLRSPGLRRALGYLWGGLANSYFMDCSKESFSPPTSIRPLTKTVGVLVTPTVTPSAWFESTAFLASGDAMQVLKASVSRPAVLAKLTNLSQTFSVEIRSWFSKIAS